MISVGRSTLIFASVAVLLLGLSVGLFLLQSGRLSACEGGRLVAWGALSLESRKVQEYVCDGLSSADCVVVWQTFRSKDLMTAMAKKRELLGGSERRLIISAETSDEERLH